MTKAVFENTENGSGLKFPVKGQGEVDWVIISSELLDDEVGDASSSEDRQAWVEKNLDMIMEAYKKKLDGGFINPPFDRIVVRREQ